MPTHDPVKRRKEIINLLSDGQWKSGKDLGTSRLLLSRMIAEGVLKEKRIKDVPFAFADNRVYCLKGRRPS